MFKTLYFVLFACVALNVTVDAEIKKISDAVVKDLDDNDVSFKKFENKCVLIVNTASACDLTKPNMKYLDGLSKKHPDLVIVVFPSNT